MNPLIQGKSGTTPVMSRNAFSTNQGTNEDDSQSDPHPEAGIFGNQTMRNSGQKDRRDTMECLSWNTMTNGKLSIIMPSSWQTGHDFSAPWQAYHGFDHWVTPLLLISPRVQVLVRTFIDYNYLC